MRMSDELRDGSFIHWRRPSAPPGSAVCRVIARRTPSHVFFSVSVV